MASISSVLNQGLNKAQGQQEHHDKLRTRKEAENAGRQMAKAERDRKKQEKKQAEQAQKATFKELRRIKADMNPEHHSRLADIERRASEAKANAKASQRMCEHGFVNCRVCGGEYHSPKASSRRGRDKIGEVLGDDDMRA